MIDVNQAGPPLPNCDIILTQASAGGIHRILLTDSDIAKIVRERYQIAALTTKDLTDALKLWEAAQELKLHIHGE